MAENGAPTDALRGKKVAESRPRSLGSDSDATRYAVAGCASGGDSIPFLLLNLRSLLLASAQTGLDVRSSYCTLGFDKSCTSEPAQQSKAWPSRRDRESKPRPHAQHAFCRRVRCSRVPSWRDRSRRVAA